MSKPLRGIFPVLQTPFGATGEVIAEDLEKEVTFCIQAGAHGLVFPVLGSEFQFLTEEERRRSVEVVIGATGGQAPVVAGVAGPDAAAAAEYARHAARAGADAVIALPPYGAPPSPQEIVDYYRAIASAADRPVFIQHSNPDMDPPLLLRLLEEIPNVLYIKEEMHPSAHNIRAVLENVGDACWGVFGGAHSRWMLSELQRGATGFMPAAEATDVHVQIWDAYQRGDAAEARRIFNRLLPLINFILILGLPACKEVLVRRGVFRSAAMRMPGQVELDDADREELERILEDLRPLLKVKD